MDVDDRALTGSQARTRAAILEATASVLARDRTATLPEIAAAAQVARSTLHRYFADRERLINETTLDSIRIISDILATAGTAEGPAVEAMRRVITTLVPEGDRIVFLFADPAVLRDIPAEDLPNSAPILELIERGQQEGVFDPGISAEWIRIALFGMMVKACSDATSGLISRHSIVPTLTRIFERGVTTPI